MQKFDKYPKVIRDFINKYGMAIYLKWEAMPLPKKSLSKLDQELQERYNEKF